MITIKITNEERYARLNDVTYDLHVTPAGDLTGSVTFWTDDGTNTVTGEMSASEYESEFGFVFASDEEN